MKPPVDNVQADRRIEDILHRLNSPAAQAAWAEWVDRYASLIHRAASQFEYEQDRAEDCFLYVCEKLCENRFKRLLSFNTSGPARFETWLGSVVHRLCVDWHRSEYGRAVLLPSIRALPLFDQAVYRLYFDQAMDRESCLHTLQEEFPGLTSGQLSLAIGRIHQVLTPRQRWRIAMGRRGRSTTGETGLRRLAEAAPDPEEKAAEDELNAKVQQALSSLEADQRLALQLRFEQGLSLQKVADLMGLGDPYRARRVLQQAQDDLAVALSRMGVRSA